jgi:hypothetical protein
MPEDPGPTPTGVPDHVYDVVLVLQQALADCYRYQRFADDARAAGDPELVDLFEELAGNDRDLAERLKPLLAARLS